MKVSGKRVGFIFFLAVIILAAGILTKRAGQSPAPSPGPHVATAPAPAPEAKPPAPEANEVAAAAPAAAPAPAHTYIKDPLVLEHFAEWLGQYVATTKARRFMAVAEGERLAEMRRDAMKELIQTDPQRAIEMSVPRMARKDLPASVVQYLEEPVSARGSFGVLAINNFDPPRMEIRREMTIDDKTYNAFVYGEREYIPSKENLPVNGIAIDNVMAIADSPVRRLEPGEDPDPSQGIGVDIGGEITHFKDEQEITKAEAELTAPEKELNPYSLAFNKGSSAGGMNARHAGHPHTPTNFLIMYDGGGGGYSNIPGSVTNTWTMGPKNILVIRVDFSDSPVDPISPANATSLLMGVVGPMYCTMSYEKTWYTNCTVTPLFRMPLPAAAYSDGADPVHDPNGFINFGTMRIHALSIATSNGYNYLDYDRDLLGFAGPSVGFGGAAYVGQRGTWINGVGAWNVHVVGHELGHNWGLGHANRWYPTNTENRTTMSSGLYVEYGNLFDIMGVGGPTTNNHFNAHFKWQLQWLLHQDGDSKTITSSGTYRVYANDLMSSTGQLRALRIQRPVQGSVFHEFWVGFRDSLTNQPWLKVGAEIIAAYSWPAGNWLLDMTPETTDIKDTPLIIGRTFHDPDNDIHITTLGHGNTSPQSLDMVVSLGTASNNLPPFATLVGTTNRVGTNETVSFTANASDPDEDTLVYWWDFKETDGALAAPLFVSNAPTANKSWATQGFYVVNCHVSDMKGGEYSAPFGVLVGTNGFKNPDTETNLASGLEYAYYENFITNVAHVASLTPVEYGTVADFNLDERNRDTNYGFRFTGWVDIPSEGIWSFFTESDDESLLYIGTNLVVDNVGRAGNNERIGYIALKAGKFPIRVDYFQKTGSHNLVVSYEGPGTAKQVIPAGSLYRYGGPTVDVPVIDPNGGSYTSTVQVSISTTTTGSTIYFTINGANPTTASTLYTAPFNLLHTGAIVRAFAVKADHRNSGFSSAAFAFPGIVNQGPTADAGPNLVVSQPQGAYLSGTAWDDAIPNPPGQLTYSWVLESGEDVEFSDPNSLNTYVTAVEPGLRSFSLTVSDSLLIAGDMVDVYFYPEGPVNEAPIVNAGPDVVITLPQDTITVTGTAEDDGLPVSPGELEYLWWHDEGGEIATYTDPTNLVSDVSFSTNGEYILGFGAYDGELWGNDYKTVTVLLPTQVAAPNIVPNGGVFTNSVSLSITSSTANATITYTTFGQPTMWSRQANAPLDLPYSTTIRAMATAPGMETSDVSQADFQVMDEIGRKIYLHDEFIESGHDDIWFFSMYTGNGDAYEEDEWLVLDSSANLSTLADSQEKVELTSNPYYPIAEHGLTYRGLLVRFGEYGNSTSLYFTASIRLAVSHGGPAPFDIEITTQPPFTNATWYFEGGDGIQEGGAIPNLQDYVNGTSTNGLWLEMTVDDTNVLMEVKTRNGSVIGSASGAHLLNLSAVYTSGAMPLVQGWVINYDENYAGGTVSWDQLDARSAESVEPNFPPVVDAGEDLQVVLTTNGTVLDATVSDDGMPNPPGALSHTWSFIYGPEFGEFADPSAEDATVYFPSAGFFILRLTSTDGELTTSDDIYVNVSLPTQAQTPTLYPNGGHFESPISLSISSRTAAASIYYTTDGSNPSTASTLYTGAFTLTNSVIIKAFATGPNYTPSAVRNATFDFSPDSPVITPNGGVYTNATTVSMTATSVGAVIYYTTDGSTPTTNSTLYTGPFQHEGNAKIKAVSVKNGLNNSPVRIAQFTFIAATPTMTPNGGVAYNPVTVTLASATTNATIHYTLDNSPVTNSSPAYTGPFIADGALYVNVRALAAKAGYSNSASFYNAFTMAAATPVITPVGGIYNNARTLTITSLTTNAIISVTTDGSSPYSNGFTYAGPFVVDSSTWVRASASKPPYNISSIANQTYNFVVTAPGMSPSGGTFSNAVNVVIGTVTTNATIYYTTNGSTPTTNSTLYTGPATVDGICTVKTFAVKPNYTNSGVLTSPLFNFNVAPPTITPTGGTHVGSVNVSFSSATTNAGFYYTTDGSTPTTNSTLYSGPFALNQPTTLKVIGAKPAYNVSAVRTAVYAIAVAPPVASPDGGTFNNAVNVSMSSVTTNTTIYYTTNGVAPTTNSAAYAAPFAVDSALSVRSFAARSGFQSSTIATSAPFAFTALGPSINPDGGSYGNAATVSMSSGTTNSSIRYTSNGAEPTTNSTLYAAPFSQDSNATLRALATKAGYAVSGTTTSAPFAFMVNTPGISPNGGTFTSSVTVALSDATTNASLYYTTDGSTPTAGSTPYSAPFALVSSATLKALGAKQGYTDSSVASAPFTIVFNGYTAGAGESYFEAEWYSRLVGAAVVVMDTNASQTNAVLAPRGVGVAACTEHDFQLPSSTTLYVWVRAGGTSLTNDAMGISFDGGAVSHRTTSTNGTYRWDKATNAFALGSGVHTLKIGAAEAGVFWDKILLTTSSTFTPSNSGGAAQSAPNGVPNTVQDVMKVYTFAGVSPTDTLRNAFQCDVDVFPFAGVAANLNSQTEATAGQYTSLATDDTNKWTTVDPGTGDQVLLWLDMVVNESVANISCLELAWSGNPAQTANMRVYVKKANQPFEQTASWVQLSDVSVNANADRTVAGYVTSGFTNYVATNGAITWAVYENVSKQTMRANHARMIVHHRGGSSAWVRPSADAYVDQASAASNFGTQTNLLAQRNATSGAKKGYLKYDLAAVTGSVQSARLRVYSEANASTSLLLSAVYSVTNDTWTETGITWNNAPAQEAAALDSRSVPNPRSYIDYDVTSFVQAQVSGDDVASFVLYEDAALGNQAAIQGRSKEAFASDRNAPPAVLFINGP